MNKINLEELHLALQKDLDSKFQPTIKEGLAGNHYDNESSMYAFNQSQIKSIVIEAIKEYHRLVMDTYEE